MRTSPVIIKDKMGVITLICKVIWLCALDAERLRIKFKIMHRDFTQLSNMSKWFGLAVVVCAVSACASLSTQLPEASVDAVSTEQARQTETALRRFTDMNSRLQKIARPVLAANADLCTKTREDIGVQMARLKSYPKELREAAQQSLGITDAYSVIFVDPRQDAIKIGDQILRGAKPIAAKAMNPNIDTLRLKRGDQEQALTSEFSQTLCDYPVSLRYSSAINAYATGFSIIVTTGMMDFASDDELALVIGHELAHNTQSHIRKIIQNRIMALGFGEFSRKFESEADYVGLYYMVRAGFDPHVAIAFWRRLAQISVKAMYEAKSHPITAERYVRLDEALREIELKQDAQTPLRPRIKNEK